MKKRWFVRHLGEIYDGPFRSKREVDRCVEEFRNKFGCDPEVVELEINPTPRTGYRRGRRRLQEVSE